MITSMDVNKELAAKYICRVLDEYDAYLSLLQGELKNYAIVCCGKVIYEHHEDAEGEVPRDV